MNSDSTNRPETRWIVLALSACLLAGGCATNSGSRGARPSGSASAITQLHLLTFPSAINTDAIPGQDGIAVKVFAGNAHKPKPFAIRDGSLEILLYDGLLKPDLGTDIRPLKTWKLSLEQLKTHEFKSTIGVGYRLTLLWTDARPTKRRATAVAKLTLPDSREIYSAPNPITLNTR